MFKIRVYHVYMMTNWNNQVLYVDVTNNLWTREKKNKLVNNFNADWLDLSKTIE